MRVTVINGSPRKNGNTCRAAEIFKAGMARFGKIEFDEFFLPDDIPEFCQGCMLCFDKGEAYCPHAAFVSRILDSMLKSDGIIFTAPVFVLQTPGSVKALLDHLAFIFVVHRPRPEMFAKKAFVISTTAGAGTGAAIKTIATNMKFWGVNRVYSLGVALWESRWDKIRPARRARFEAKLAKCAAGFYRELASGKRRPVYPLIRFMTVFNRRLLKAEGRDLDREYWRERGWMEKSPFRKT